jgi:hypothetical protein
MNTNISSTSTEQHNKEVSTYDMPPSMDHTKEAQPLGKERTIKGILKSYVKILNDPSSIKVLQNMLERCSIEAKGKI